MSHIHERDPETISLEWPQCPFLEGRCLLDQLGQALGPEILESLLAFTFEPQPGSRFSLQRNRNEFTAQITGPVARSTGPQVRLSDYQSIRRNLPSPD